MKRKIIFEFNFLVLLITFMGYAVSEDMHWIATMIIVVGCLAYSGTYMIIEEVRNK